MPALAVLTAAANPPLPALDTVSAGRLIAGWLAVMFVAVGVIGFIRLSRLPTLVLILAFLGAPLLGLAKYVLSPHPLGSFDAIYLALPFIGIGISLALASTLLRVGAGPVSTFASILRRAPLFLLAWPFVVLALACVVWPFEPGFAIAGVVANGLWFAVWIPPVTRRLAQSGSYEIAAPRERVFAFITDPSNWSRYLGDVIDAEVRPSGPLAEGSQILTRRRFEVRGLRGPLKLMPQVLESAEVVTRLVPDTLLASRRSDGIEATASVELSSVDSRTAVTTQSAVVMPYRLALVGGVLEAIMGMPRQRAKSRQNQDRLRKLLEEPAPAQ